MTCNVRANNHLTCSVLAVLLALSLSVAVAQPADEATADAASPDVAATEGEETGTIFSLILKSGWVGWLFMAILGIFSLVSATVAIERLVNLTRGKVIPADFVRDLEERVRRGQGGPERFRDLCERSAAPIANILKAGLLRSSRPLPEVEKSMEDAAARESSTLRSRVRPLNVVGSVAPLVGLLGTVVGMIFAFRNASQAGLGKAEVLAEGIYLALLTTAAGLTIAIPALLFAAFFNARVERFMREIDERLMETMPCFAGTERSEPNTREQETARRPTTTSNPLMTGARE